MKIEIEMTIKKHCYFCITDNFSAATSKEFADLFNLDTNTYNKLLTDKVIKHSNYTIDVYNKDLMFDLNNISKEIYIERFKDTFSNELTLLALGGN